MHRKLPALFLLAMVCCPYGTARPQRPTVNPKFVQVSNVALLAPATNPLPKRMWPLQTGEAIQLKYPLPYIAREVSPFGWRFSEQNNKWRIHAGYDLIAPTGTPVLAALAGKVSMVQPINGYGLTVLLDHGNGWQTLYAHLLSSQVRLGQLVTKAYPIGRVGKSGSTSTAHLHFELRRMREGQIVAIDPSPLLP